VTRRLRESGKVTVLDGDITQQNCGLTEINLDTVREQVSIIVHCASTINLKSSLNKVAPSIVYASGFMAELSFTCPNLIKFAYVSSAYASTFLRKASDGTFYGADAVISEEVNPIKSQSSSLEKELANLRLRSDTDEFGHVLHLSAYTYAKHLTERMLLHEFERRGFSSKLLIFRPALIGPAEEFPAPFFEIPGSCPVSSFFAAVLTLPPLKMNFSSQLDNPEDSTFDEVPLDIVVNRLIVHVAYGTSGCVHAVPHAEQRQVTKERWDQMTALRPIWWSRPQLIWNKVDWTSDKLCPLARLFTVCGNSFKFEDTKSEDVWQQMTEAEHRVWPLWPRYDLKDLRYLHGRKKSVEAQAGGILSKHYGLPSCLSKVVCNKVGRSHL
jgi:hypothetical protein